MLPTPKVLVALLADAHKITPSGKVDVFGLFDKVHVWATPATREHSLVMRFGGLAPGRHGFQIDLEGPSKKRKVLITAEVEAPEVSTPKTVIAANRVTIVFNEIGFHRIGVRFSNGSDRSRFQIPIEVEQLPWPETPAGDDLDALLKDPLSIKLLRAEVACGKCKTKHIFEVHLDPSKSPSRGAKLFPKSGRFKCPKCRSTLELRDIEGQMRVHLGKATPRVSE